ncbi:MAG: SHOCT domain-containing protein [Acidimicrobiales bacterium]
MAFPPKLLNDNEEIVLDLRPHWWALSGPTTLLLALVVVAVIVPGRFHGDLRPPVRVAVLVALLAGLIWFALRYARWMTTNFVVTTDRLVLRSGVLSKQGREIPLDRLNDIGFHQTLFERVIGAGDLLLESAGARGQESVSDIPHPARVQNEIYRQIEAARTKQSDRAEGRRELSVPEQLEKLDELRQRGVISQAEFDDKKAQLLGRM